MTEYLSPEERSQRDVEELTYLRETLARVEALADALHGTTGLEWVEADLRTALGASTKTDDEPSHGDTEATS